METTKNMIGAKFGRLTVVEELPYRTGVNNRLTYRCICDCGKEHITAGANLRSGRVKSCGCYKRDFVEKNKFARVEDRECAILKVHYSHLVRRNKKKGFINIIDFNAFCDLSKQPCYYCGASPAQQLEDRVSETKSKKRVSETIVLVNGIDRVDSNKGYSAENCVPCCKHCNTAKNTMSNKEFLAWIKRVYDYNYSRLSQ